MNLKRHMLQTGCTRTTDPTIAAHWTSPAILIIVLLLSCTDLAKADSAGDALATAVYNRADGHSSTVHARMLLRSSTGRERIREFYSYRKDFEDKNTRSLIRFSLPANVSGTALLVHSNYETENDQWLFLPALERIRRISSKNRGGRFVQSGIYYEDLQERRPSEDNHSINGKSEYEGTPVTVLESIPKNSNSSSYSKRISWIHVPTLVPLRIEYYQRGETPVKVLEVKQLESIEGFWTVTESVVTLASNGDQTIVRNLRTQYDRDLPDTLFTSRGLSDVTLEARYRAFSE